MESITPLVGFDFISLLLTEWFNEMLTRVVSLSEMLTQLKLCKKERIRIELTGIVLDFYIEIAKLCHDHIVLMNPLCMIKIQKNKCMRTKISLLLITTFTKLCSVISLNKIWSIICLFLISYMQHQKSLWLLNC